MDPRPDQSDSINQTNLISIVTNDVLCNESAEAQKRTYLLGYITNLEVKLRHYENESNRPLCLKYERILKRIKDGVFRCSPEILKICESQLKKLNENINRPQTVLPVGSNLIDLTPEEDKFSESNKGKPTTNDGPLSMSDILSQIPPPPIISRKPSNNAAQRSSDFHRSSPSISSAGGSRLLPANELARLSSPSNLQRGKKIVDLDNLLDSINYTAQTVPLEKEKFNRLRERVDPETLALREYEENVKNNFFGSHFLPAASGKLSDTLELFIHSSDTPSARAKPPRPVSPPEPVPPPPPIINGKFPRAKPGVSISETKTTDRLSRADEFRSDIRSAVATSNREGRETSRPPSPSRKLVSSVRDCSGQPESKDDVRRKFPDEMTQLHRASNCSPVQASLRSSKPDLKTAASIPSTEPQNLRTSSPMGSHVSRRSSTGIPVSCTSPSTKVPPNTDRCSPAPRSDDAGNQQIPPAMFADRPSVQSSQSSKIPPVIDKHTYRSHEDRSRNFRPPSTPRSDDGGNQRFLPTTVDRPFVPPPIIDNPTSRSQEDRRPPSISRSDDAGNQQIPPATIDRPSVPSQNSRMPPAIDDPISRSHEDRSRNSRSPSIPRSDDAENQRIPPTTVGRPSLPSSQNSRMPPAIDEPTSRSQDDRYRNSRQPSIPRSDEAGNQRFSPTTVDRSSVPPSQDSRIRPVFDKRTSHEDRSRNSRPRSIPRSDETGNHRSPSVPPFQNSRMPPVYDKPAFRSRNDRSRTPRPWSNNRPFVNRQFSNDNTRRNVHRFSHGQNNNARRFESDDRFNAAPDDRFNAAPDDRFNAACRSETFTEDPRPFNKNFVPSPRTDVEKKDDFTQRVKESTEFFSPLSNMYPENDTSSSRQTYSGSRNPNANSNPNPGTFRIPKLNKGFHTKDGGVDHSVSKNSPKKPRKPTSPAPVGSKADDVLSSVLKKKEKKRKRIEGRISDDDEADSDLKGAVTVTNDARMNKKSHSKSRGSKERSLADREVSSDEDESPVPKKKFKKPKVEDQTIKETVTRSPSLSAPQKVGLTETQKSSVPKNSCDEAPEITMKRKLSSSSDATAKKKKETSSAENDQVNSPSDAAKNNDASLPAADPDSPIVECIQDDSKDNKPMPIVETEKPTASEEKTPASKEPAVSKQKSATLESKSATGEVKSSDQTPANPDKISTNPDETSTIAEQKPTSLKQKSPAIEQKSSILEPKSDIPDQKASIAKKKFIIPEPRCTISEQKATILERKSYIPEQKYSIKGHSKADADEDPTDEEILIRLKSIPSLKKIVENINMKGTKLVTHLLLTLKPEQLKLVQDVLKSKSEVSTTKKSGKLDKEVKHEKSSKSSKSANSYPSAVSDRSAASKESSKKSKEAAKEASKILEKTETCKESSKPAPNEKTLQSQTKNHSNELDRLHADIGNMVDTKNSIFSAVGPRSCKQTPIVKDKDQKVKSSVVTGGRHTIASSSEESSSSDEEIKPSTSKKSQSKATSKQRRVASSSSDSAESDSESVPPPSKKSTKRDSSCSNRNRSSSSRSKVPKKLSRKSSPDVRKSEKKSTSNSRKKETAKGVEQTRFNVKDLSTYKFILQPSIVLDRLDCFDYKELMRRKKMRKEQEIASKNDASKSGPSNEKDVLKSGSSNKKDGFVNSENIDKSEAKPSENSADEEPSDNRHSGTKSSKSKADDNSSPAEKSKQKKSQSKPKKSSSGSKEKATKSSQNKSGSKNEKRTLLDVTERINLLPARNSFKDDVSSLKIDTIAIELRGEKLSYVCTTGSCGQNTYDSCDVVMFTNHLSYLHEKVKWNGRCGSCDEVNPKSDLIDALAHLMEAHLILVNKAPKVIPLLPKIALDNLVIPKVEVSAKCTSPDLSENETVQVEPHNEEELTERADAGELTVVPTSSDVVTELPASRPSTPEPSDITPVIESVSGSVPSVFEQVDTPDISAEVSSNSICIPAAENEPAESTALPSSSTEITAHELSTESSPAPLMQAENAPVQLTISNVTTTTPGEATSIEEPAPSCSAASETVETAEELPASVVEVADSSDVVLDVPPDSPESDSEPRLRVRRLSGDVLSGGSSVNESENAADEPVPVSCDDSDTTRLESNTDDDDIAKLKINSDDSDFALLGMNSDDSVIAPLKPSQTEDKFNPVIMEVKTMQQNQTETTSPTSMKSAADANENCAPNVPTSSTKRCSVRELQDARRMNFYKCGEKVCFFSTDAKDVFRNHFDEHLSKKKRSKKTEFTFLNCVYCSQLNKTPEKLISHMNEAHLFSKYQCPYCDYRACRPTYVFHHLQAEHPAEQKRILVPDLEDNYEIVRRNNLGEKPMCKVVPEYFCAYGCTYFTLSTYEFIDHIEKNHQQLDSLDCHLCHQVCFNLECLLKHYSFHFFAEYQCIYCMNGFSSAESMKTHLTQLHHSSYPKAVRRACSAEDVIEGPVKYLDLDEPTENFRQYFKEVNRNVTNEDSTDRYCDLVACDRQNSSLACLSASIGAHGLSFSSATRSGNLNSNSSVTAVQSPINAGISKSNSSTKSRAPLTVMGLSGKDLYRCGNTGCAVAVDDLQAFKEHHRFCDNARNTSSLTCVHCRRSFVRLDRFFEHIGSHGVPRYFCSLCDFKHTTGPKVSEHMKVHKVSKAKAIPADSKRNDRGVDIYFIVPDSEKKDRGLFKAIERPTTEKQQHKPAFSARASQATPALPIPQIITVYAAKDVEEQLPSQLFKEPVKCGHCDYSTKVRTNILFHLKSHVSGLVTNKEIVNPVPQMEKTELMFNKMTNHAAYSTKDGEKRDVVASNVQNLGLNEASINGFRVPVFVPNVYRFSCGAPGCPYVSQDGSGLKKHFETLHAEMKRFRCPHCAIQIPLNKIFVHLRYHGAKLFQCAYCVFLHFQNSRIEKHQRDHHPEKEISILTLRQLVVDDKRNDEIRTCAPENSERALWQCNLCKSSFSRENLIKAHCQLIHGLEDSYKCPMCSFSAADEEIVLSHLETSHQAASQVVIKIYKKIIQENLNTTDNCSRSAAVSSTTDEQSCEVSVSPAPTDPLKQVDRVAEIADTAVGSRVEQMASVSSSADNTSTIIISDRTSSEEDNNDKSNLLVPPYSAFLYRCPLCDIYRTPYENKMRDHMYLEQKYYKYVCTACGKTGVSRRELEPHLVEEERTHPRKKYDYFQTFTIDEELESRVQQALAHQTNLMKLMFQKTAPKNQLIDNIIEISDDEDDNDVAEKVATYADSSLSTYNSDAVRKNSDGMVNGARCKTRIVQAPRGYGQWASNSTPRRIQNPAGAMQLSLRIASTASLAVGATLSLRCRWCDSKFSSAFAFKAHQLVCDRSSPAECIDQIPTSSSDNCMPVEPNNSPPAHVNIRRSSEGCNTGGSQTADQSAVADLVRCGICGPDSEPMSTSKLVAHRRWQHDLLACLRCHASFVGEKWLQDHISSAFGQLVEGQPNSECVPGAPEEVVMLCAYCTFAERGNTDVTYGRVMRHIESQHPDRLTLTDRRPDVEVRVRSGEPRPLARCEVSYMQLEAKLRRPSNSGSGDEDSVVYVVSPEECWEPQRAEKRRRIAVKSTARPSMF